MEISCTKQGALGYNHPPPPPIKDPAEELIPGPSELPLPAPLRLLLKAPSLPSLRRLVRRLHMPATTRWSTFIAVKHRQQTLRHPSR